MHKIMAQRGNNDFFLAIMKILSGVHQGMRAETGIKVSTLFGLILILVLSLCQPLALTTSNSNCYLCYVTVMSK